jgi:acyl dehydratase
MGITANSLLGDGDPATLKSIRVRFASPVYPEDELTVEGDGGEEQERFVVRNQSEEEVITKGRALYR